MASFETVFLVVVLCIGVISCQDLRPKRDTEPKDLLQDELEKIESAFMDRTVLQIKDVRGRNGNLDYELSNIVVQNYENVETSVETEDGDSNAKVTVTLDTLNTTADWWAQYKSWLMGFTKEGSLIATAENIEVKVTLVDFEVDRCRATADLSLSVTGLDGMVGRIVGMFKSCFVNRIESEIERDRLDRSVIYIDSCYVK